MSDNLDFSLFAELTQLRPIRVNSIGKTIPKI